MREATAILLMFTALLGLGAAATTVLAVLLAAVCEAVGVLILTAAMAFLFIG